ncbi:MAG: glycosyltransferase [Phycisphaerales bacterium]
MPFGSGDDLRVLLFTDTLADVNGVARFIGDLAREARRREIGLTVVTSTDLPLAPASNVVNLTPRAAGAMPGYPLLRLVPPPLARARALVRAARPHAVHLSTPGPVGFAGLLAARAARVPILATYHTDFPAYIEELWHDPSFSWLCRSAMRAFYAPVSKVFTRSVSYARGLHGLGIHCRRITSLRPGTDTEAFHPRFRDRSIWPALGCAARSIKVLSMGRVSVEKNLPLLARAWPVALAAMEARGLDVELVVVGDGPYRACMEQELAGSGARARFLGFRHGRELSTIYASSDLLVFPSETDTLGQVVMEAQSSGIPVIVSSVGGPREVTRHGRTGLIIPESRPGLWADAIADLAGDEARRRDMGQAARALMEEHAFPRSFEHWWDVHRRVVDGQVKSSEERHAGAERLVRT